MSKRKTAVTDRMPSVQASPFQGFRTTPFPWTYSVSESAVTGADGHAVCEAKESYPMGDLPLLAAAPELLASLQAIVRETDGGKRGCCGATISRAASAIQKALGK